MGYIFSEAADRGRLRQREESLMAALGYGVTDPVDPIPNRNLLLRMLDAWAEWQMRQSLRVICRGKGRCDEHADGPAQLTSGA